MSDALRKRLLSKIRVDEKTGCWIWTASMNRGYGQLSSKRGCPPHKAHRLAYELFVGPVGDLFVLHKCDTPACCNPSHLTLGTQADNMRGASERGRINPRSFRNLRPGAPGHYGAGPVSNKEKFNE